MKLFNKTIDRQLFKQYALGSDLSKQEVVVKIFNPQGAGRWYILNSDPQDPDYLWAIVDLGYGAEVGSVSRNDLESYCGKFGLGFERDLGFDPVNAEELFKGLHQGKFYANGGGVDDYSDLYGQEVMALKNAKNQAKRTGYDYLVYLNKEGEISFARKNEFERFFDKDECKVLYTIDEKGNINKIKTENNFAYGGETKNKYKSYKDFVNKNIGKDKIVVSVGSGGQSQPLGGATEESIEKQFKELVFNNFTDYEFSANYMSQYLLKEYNSFVKKFYNSLIENPKEFIQFWNEFVIESGSYDSIYAIRPAIYDEKGKYIESREWIDGKWVKNYVPHYPDLIFSKYKKEMPLQLIKEYQDYLKEYAGNEIGYSFADGGNLSRDQKSLNKSEDYEVKYSKGTNRKGYEKHSFAEGGNLRQSLEDVLKQDVTFLKFSSNRAYSNFERLKIPFINVHDYDFNHYYIIETKNLEKVLDYITKGVIVVKKKFSSDDLGFDYKGSKSFADGGLFQPISTQKQEERQKLKENIIKALFVDKKNPITEVALTHSNSKYSVPNINKQDIRNMVLDINQTKKYKNIIVYTNSYGVLSLKVENSFKDGGDLEDFSDNQRMIMNQNVELEHHHEELEDILKEKTPVPAWAVAKMATATESVSDVTHYLDGQKELMEDENEAEKQNIIENYNVVKPINISADTKAEMTKKFTDDALGNLKGFLQGMNEIELRDDYTFDYKNEQFEIEPIINSDQNGVSNAVFTIFDGDGQEVGEVAYSSDGGKQRFTANSKLFAWNNTKFEDGGFMGDVYANGGDTSKNVVIQKSGQGVFTQWNIIDAKSPFSFSTEVFFDSKEESEKFATKKGFNIVTSFENEYAEGCSTDEWEKGTTINFKTKKEASDRVLLMKNHNESGVDYKDFRVEKNNQGYCVKFEFKNKFEDGGSVKRTRRTNDQIRKDNYNKEVDLYNWYVVNVSELKAESGFEYKQDALDLLSDYEGDKNFKVVSKKSLKNLGIEIPNESWKYADGGSFDGIAYAKTKGKESIDWDKELKEYAGEKEYQRLTPREKEEIISDLQRDWDRSNSYEKGGAIAKAEILGFSKNRMGTTDIQIKITGMRKPQDFIVYPIGKDDAGSVITIQSETRIGQINLVKGVGVMSQSHSSGAYFVHLQMDKLTHFTLSESDLEDLKISIFKTSGSNVGSSIVKSDNSGASRIFAKGGGIDVDKMIKAKDDLAKDVLKKIDELSKEDSKKKIIIFNKQPYRTTGSLFYTKDRKIYFQTLKVNQHEDIKQRNGDIEPSQEEIKKILSQVKNDKKFNYRVGHYYGMWVLYYDESKSNPKEITADEMFYFGAETTYFEMLRTYEEKFENGGDVLERGKKSGWGNVSEEEDSAIAWYRSLSINQQKEVDKHLESYKANLTEEKFKKRGLSVRDFGRTYRKDKLIHIWKSEGSPEPQDSFANGGSTGDVYADGGQIRVGDRYKSNWTDTDENQGYTIREVVKQNITSSKDFRTKVMIMKVVESSMPEQVGRLEEEYKPSFKKRIGWGLEIPINERMPKLADEDYAKGGRLEDKLTKLEKKKSDLESKLFEAKLAENKVMNNIGFGAGMRRSKVSISTTRTDSLKTRIEAVEKEIEQTKKDMLPKKPKYILKADIKTVTVKRNGKKVTYNSADVLNGANVLEKGGDLTSKANYIPKRDVVSVELKEGTTVKPVNGYWVKKGAEPIGAEPKSTQSLNTLSDNEKEIDEKLALFTKSDKELNRLMSDSNKEFDKKTKLEKERLALIKKGVSDTEEIDAKIKDAKEKGNLYSEQAMDLLKKYQEDLAQPKNSSSAKSPSKVGETYIKKGAYGWSATTNIDDFNDYDWRISTFKTSSGQLVTSAKAGKVEQGDGYTTFKYTMYQDPHHTLEVSKPSRLTEKVVAEQHAKGLAKFKNLMETGVFKGGGKISTFDKVSAKIAKEFEGKPVKNKYQEEYGKYYSKEEAEIVGDKIAGKRRAMDVDKKAFGGLFSHVKKLTDSKPKYPNLEGKQVFLKTGELVQVFTQSDNTLSVLEVGKMTSGVRPHSIDISEVNISSFKSGGELNTKTSNNGTETLKKANALATKIRMKGESWLDAKKRAFAQLKKQNEA